MLTRKVSVQRRARHAARLPDSTRPHGRRSAYAHSRTSEFAREPRRPGVPLGVFLVIGSVFAFLMLVVSGTFVPKTGPLSKHEPVSTARIK
jgi:hypothetical protein